MIYPDVAHDLDLGFEVDFRAVDRRLASRMQIIQAAKLLVLEGEPISAMTLICAALDVLEGVSRSRNLKTWIEQGIKDYGDGVLIARRNIRFQYNYLKHSDKDPSRELHKLCPDIAIILIYGAIHDYEQLYGCLSIEMLLMRMWALTRISALRDDPDYRVLGAKLEMLFSQPSSLSFEEARTKAAPFLEWCLRDSDDAALQFFGPPPQVRRCQYATVGSFNN